LRALADTNTFVWVCVDVPHLSPAAREFIEDGANEILLSAASAWEIAIKAAKGPGHLGLPEPAPEFVNSRMAKHGFQPLPITMNHALLAGSLPPFHRDPFDRLLVAQAQIERLPIITSDPDISRYDVEVLW
jgi:PIN domain nuclease of toxin-antitoxin system